MIRYVQYVAPLFIAAIVAATLAMAAWRRRPAPGAQPFAMLMAAVGLWAFGYAFELYAATLPAKVLWAKVEYLAIVFVPLLWLLFAIEYANHEGWLTPLRRRLLGLLPLTILALVWTNEWHGLIWQTLTLVDRGALSILDVSYGPIFWLHALYSYLLLAVATGLLLRMIARSARIYRSQAIRLLIGVFAPWLSNAVYLLNLGPAIQLDLTPFAFTITGLAFGWSLLRSHLLDIVPVARDAVLERMSDGVIVLNAQQRIVDLNPAAQRIVGRSGKDSFGLPIDQVLPGWPEKLRLTADDADEARVELVFEALDEPQTYDMRITPITNQRGAPNGSLVVLRDVTERKRAERILLQQNGYLIALHDTALQLINRLDLAAVLEAITTRAQQLLNAPSAFLFVDRPAEQVLVAEVVLGKFAGARGFRVSYTECVVGQVRTSGETVTVDNYSAWAGRLPAFEPLELGTVIALPLRSEEQIIGVLGLAYDEADHQVSQDEHDLLMRFAQLAALAFDNAQLFASVQSLYDEQRKLADQLLQAKDLAEAASRAKTDFISFVSHELRNPMTAMRGYVELMQMGAAGPLSREQMDMLGILYTNIAHMTSLVSDLIDTARIEGGRMKFEFETIPLVDLLDGVVLSIHSQLESKDQMLHMRIAPDLPPIWADRVRVTQILSNLMSNAHKYTPRGGQITILIDQHTEHIGDAALPMVHVAIQDTGIGISEEEQHRVFEQFFRSEHEYARTITGSGLGLAITRSLVELQGGRIWFYSQRNQGTTFHFTLPTANLTAREQQPALAHARSA